jgi:hypothetical protein
MGPLALKIEMRRELVPLGQPIANAFDRTKLLKDLRRRNIFVASPAIDGAEMKPARQIRVSGVARRSVIRAASTNMEPSRQSPTISTTRESHRGVRGNRFTVA